MAKAKSRTKKVAPPKSKPILNTKEFQAEHTLMIQNGLSDALGLNDGLMGFNPGSMGTQLSQVDTLFKNNRWYLVSNMRQLLSEIYVEIGLVQTIVDVPVDDGLRGGIEIVSKQLSEDQIEELQVSMDSDDDLTTIGLALKWNRLYGGAGIVVMTNQDPSQPLDLAAIKKDSPLEFRAVDMWELFWTKQNVEDEEYDPEIQESKFEFYNYYAKQLHKSRVMAMKGLTPPSFIRPRLRGWGFSVVESLVQSINQYLKASNLTFEVLDEFKLDVYKLKNLVTTLMSPNGEARVRQRIDIANKGKNFQNAIALDSEDDYVQKQLSFSGLAEAQTGIRLQVASDMRMPITKLFGTSVSAGMKTDQNDMENYNSMVESQVRSKCKHYILKIVELKCQKLFGMIPDDLKIKFKPLRVLTAEEEEAVKTAKYNRVHQARQLGEITSLEYREAINRDNLLPIQLETTVAALSEIEEENEEQEQADQADEKSKDDKKDDDGKKKVNSLDYEVAAFETDGGDQQYSPWHERQFKSPGKVDTGLWSESKSASMKAFGKVKWQFVIWYYTRHGGKFN